MAGVVFVVALAVFTLVNRPPASLPGTAGSAPAPAPSSSVSTEARIGGLEAALERGDGEPETYAALGSALMQRLRETGDAGLYRRADMAFAEALERDPSNLDATVGLGTLALARHDFRAGLRHGLRAQRINPSSFAPFAVLVDARIELGRYAAAERTLQQMIDFKPALASYARVSYYRELHGDLEGALDAMRLAVSSAPGPGENRSYVQTLLGNLEFERGRIAAAEDAYRMALAGFAAYAPAEAGLARVDAARGRLGSAIARLRGVVQRLPLPGYVIALGETELAAGRPVAAKASFDLVRAQQRLLGASGVNTDAEIAVFEADHGDSARALRLARDGYEAAPSVRSADALGWALTRAGRPRAGLAYARQALRLGSRDPLFRYHAGVAARAAGQVGAARGYLSSSLAANPRFSPLHAPRARRALRGVL
ncbi:MAG: tetratricopeptide repeat protein [Thermoleophilaceae bacterium]